VGRFVRIAPIVDERRREKNPRPEKEWMVAVNRCVCHEVTFAELIEMARRDHMTLADLQKATGCGTGCGTCVPYIEIALRTGIADLPILNISRERTETISDKADC